MERARKVLKTYFGYDTFREGQEAVIREILKGRDVLAVMPTGAGKSVCYQIPALLMEGITIVVSPLISLMTDQVKALNEAGVHAAYINSSLTETQTAKALENAAKGVYRIIYVAPERLETARFLDFACHAEISMVTVDEAHCISQWGQDFRPSYQKILSFVQRLAKRPVISAFTATATERVREDILDSLKLVEPFVITTGFDRKNLYFQVDTGKEKKKKIREYLKAHREESGIIYCATRKNVDELYLLLDGEGFPVGRYHAGMSADSRRENQEDFIYDRKKIIIATNAFGMGIDKSNVRFVLHFNMPQSMENYYQEGGRAGRDGAPAECILYYSPQDVRVNQFLLDNKENMGDYTPEEQRIIWEQDRKRLAKMTAYCTTKKCLRKYILNYFGEETGEKCGNCSNCLEDYEEMEVYEIAADMVGCVKDLKERFGSTVVLGVLAGADTARLRSGGLKNSRYYARQPKSQELLKEVLLALTEEGYLRVTQDRYPVLKLTGRSEEFLQKETEFYIFRKKKETAAATPKQRRKKGSDVELSALGMELFDSLRKLRMKLAKKRGIPPYMVASDKALKGMCERLPRTKEEMLEVGGIGEKKYEQYGAEFLACIRSFLEEKKDDTEVEKCDMIETAAGLFPTPEELRQEEEREKNGGKER